MNPVTGAFKDIRKPDDQIRKYQASAAPRARKVDWSPHNPKLPNQINLPMCVGEASNVNDTVDADCYLLGLRLRYV